MDYSVEGVIGSSVAVASLIVGIVTYLRANPKRVLEYGYRVLPLVTARGSVRKRLTVHFDGEELSNPHVIEIILRSDGRSDIAVESFSGGQDLVFDIGVEATALDSGDDNQAFELRNTRLHFKPNVIKRSNKPFRIELICASKPSPLKTSYDPLVGVVLREIRKSNADWQYGWKLRRWERAIQWVARVCIAVMLGIAIGGLSGLL